MVCTNIHLVVNSNLTLKNCVGPLLTKEELEVFQYKTDRYLRLRELLLDHCSDSNLVVM
jgi:hypothetical protein